MGGLVGVLAAPAEVRASRLLLQDAFDFRESFFRCHRFSAPCIVRAKPNQDCGLFGERQWAHSGFEDYAEIGLKRATSAAGISLNRPFHDRGVLPPACSGGKAHSSTASSTRPAFSAGASNALSGR